MEYDAEYWQDRVDEIMDEFDFDKVARVMEFLDWKWRGVLPTKGDIRREARTNLRRVVEYKRGCATGGFYYKIDVEEGVLTLEFVLEGWDAYAEDKPEAA